MTEPTLREIIDNFTIWRDHLIRWWESHQPDEHELEIARAELKRPEVLAELVKLGVLAQGQDSEE